VVLDGPEGFTFVFDGHHNLPVLGTIVRPCQRLNVSIILQHYVQRVVSYGVGLANAFEQLGAVVVDPGYLAMFHHIQPFQMGAEFNGETL
jgi:hypothetical protein